MRARIFFFSLLPSILAETDSTDTSEVNGKKLYPTLRTFPNKQALVDSYLWSYFTEASHDIAALTTAIYIEDTKTIFVLAEPKTRDLVSAGKELLGLTKKHSVSMTEIDLGAELLSVGSDYFPLVTISAEYSSGIATVDREVTQSYKVQFSPGVNRAFGLAVVSIKAVLGITIGSERAEREIVTCTARAGGKVQLQVSNRMLHFPKARTRNVKFVVKNKEFIDSTWEEVKSAVADEEHVGALFYENFKLGKHRCVTDAAFFEDAGSRKWLEWSEPHTLED